MLSSSLPTTTSTLLRMIIHMLILTAIDMIGSTSRGRSLVIRCARAFSTQHHLSFSCRSTDWASNAKTRSFPAVIWTSRILEDPRQLTTTRSNPKLFMSSTKPGVASVEELKAIVDAAGDKLLIVDVRNPDAEVEPGDQKSLAVAAMPSEGYRPKAISAVWDRSTNTLPLDAFKDLPKDTPIITHCGGGGRGQQAKELLQKEGFTNVVNGAGPKETELWAVYGEK